MIEQNKKLDCVLSTEGELIIENLADLAIKGNIKKQHKKVSPPTPNDILKVLICTLEKAPLLLSK